MKLYTCSYCYSEFEPTRRRVQKYCSNTCRSKAYHKRKSNTNKLPTQNKTTTPTELTSTPPTKTKIDSMSTYGVGNAAVGSLIADGIKSLATSNKNKPATKNDIAELKALVTNRYLPINNIPLDQYGRHPFYDTDTKSVIYLKNTF